MSADRGAAGTLGALDPAGPDNDRLASLPAVAGRTVGLVC
jgi:hypothetical protein